MINILEKKEVRWNNKEEVFEVKIKLKEGVKYYYFDDVVNEGFVFWKSKGKVKYKVDGFVLK